VLGAIGHSKPPVRIFSLKKPELIFPMFAENISAQGAFRIHRRIGDEGQLP
jgi:hypothetical protein